MAAPYEIPLLDQVAINDFFAQFLSSLSNLNLHRQESPKCTLCQSLTFETLLSGFQLHENFEALCASSFSCPLCRIFQSALLNQPPENWWPDEEILSSDVLMAKLVRDARELNRFPERLEITVLRSEGEIKKQLEHDKYDKHPEIKLVKHCIVCVAPEYPLASELRIRPIRKEANCEENIQLIKSWVNDCSERHEECQSEPGRLQPELPSRVIDVGPADGTQEPKLFVSGSESGRWVALSYRWGDAKFLKLLNENITQFEKEIPLETMPRTFQDAVWLTRQLDIRYLWIDSLCIIQDSEADWRIESGMMPNIYAGAYLTLSSSANEDPTGGLFDKRDYHFTHAEPVRLDLGPDQGVLEFTTRRHYHSASGSSQHEPLVKDHLVDRGWCLQEKVLSRRFLTFHPTEISFMCRKNILLESYYEQDPIWQLKQRGPFGAMMRRYIDGDGSWKNDFFQIVKNAAVPGTAHNENRRLVHAEWEERLRGGESFGYSNTTPELTNRQKLHERWYNVLHDYTCRKLTYEKDKLVAISGVAKYILANSGIKDDEYHAGIFKSMLPHSLMWKIPEQKSRGQEWMNSRPKEYTAPSWSWASMNQYLDFERCWKYVEEAPTCEVVAMESTSSWEDTCSAVVGGKITIRGKAKRAFVNPWNDHLCHPNPEEVGRNKGDHIGLGVVHLDERTEEDQFVLCLELFSCQGLLLVEKEGNQGVYQRVGIYSMNDWYRPDEQNLVEEYTII